MSSPPLLDDRVLSTEPVIGWRAWRMSVRRDVVRLHPLGKHRRPWKPKLATRATCGRRRLHRAPSVRCGCGLHLAKDPALLTLAPSPAVIGTAALWGRVVEHELGYRGELGYPQRLRLVCPECLWWPPSPGSSADVVAVLPRGLAVPLCNAHLVIANESGLTIRSLRSAHEIESRLLSTYRVDLLPQPRPHQLRAFRTAVPESQETVGFRQPSAVALVESKD